MTSAAKDRPIASGGGEVDWSIRATGELQRHERGPCPDREHKDSV